MLRLEFENIFDLCNFLNYTNDMRTFECPIVKIYTSYGMKMDINTKIYDPLGLHEYMTLEQLLLMIINFVQTNAAQAITFELKIKCPNAQRKSFDPNDYYSAFYLNCYSNTNTTIAKTSYQETSTELVEAPVIAWMTLIQGFYNAYQNSKF